MSDEKEPGQKLDERYETLLAKATETAQAQDRDHQLLIALRDEIDAIRRQLPAKRNPNDVGEFG